MRYNCVLIPNFNGRIMVRNLILKFPFAYIFLFTAWPMCHARQKSCRTRTHMAIKYARQTNINTGVNLKANLGDTTMNRPENAFQYKHFHRISIVK